MTVTKSDAKGEPSVTVVITSKDMKINGTLFGNLIRMMKRKYKWIYSVVTSRYKEVDLSIFMRVI